MRQEGWERRGKLQAAVASASGLTLVAAEDDRILVAALVTLAHVGQLEHLAE